jgi:hypothetical protein
MSLEVQITKVSQDISLTNGETENFVLLELPNGSVVRARVNEKGATAVMDCFVNKERASTRVNQESETFEPPPLEGWPGPVPSTGFRETTAPDGSTALEFGGQEDVAPVRIRARVVQADASGNPIVHGGDPGEVHSGVGADEDGVEQA